MILDVKAEVDEATRDILRHLYDLGLVLLHVHVLYRLDHDDWLLAITPKRVIGIIPVLAERKLG